jgi:cytochrome c biogenesis protein CcmG/thiol:disulfide interchange protein DsbE
MRRPVAANIPALVCLIVATLVAGCKGPQDDVATFRALDVGTSVPTYQARTLAGDSVRIGTNEPITVLNVWATWCVSCQEEMAALDSIKREFGARGVRVIAVSVDKADIEHVRRFAEANHLTMTVAHDSEAMINQAYQVVGVPSTFVIGADGKLIWRRTGNIIGVVPEVEGAVQKALKN